MWPLLLGRSHTPTGKRRAWDLQLQQIDDSRSYHCYLCKHNVMIMYGEKKQLNCTMKPWHEFFILHYPLKQGYYLVHTSICVCPFTLISHNWKKSLKTGSNCHHGYSPIEYFVSEVELATGYGPRQSMMAESNTGYCSTKCYLESAVPNGYHCEWHRDITRSSRSCDYWSKGSNIVLAVKPSLLYLRSNTQ
jgi:hypothetical protein